MAYRYFLSVYEYTGFHFAGRIKNTDLVIDEVIGKFGEDKGKMYLTFFVTSERYIFGHTNGKEYGKKLIENIVERYGESVLIDYVKEFKRKYEGKYRFRQETKYYADAKIEYVDDSLVL